MQVRWYINVLNKLPDAPAPGKDVSWGGSAQRLRELCNEGQFDAFGKANCGPPGGFATASAARRRYGTMTRSALGITLTSKCVPQSLSPST